MRSPLQHHHAVTIGVALLALCAGFVLIPRSDEHVTMLARDGYYEEASKLLMAMGAAGDRRPELLLQAASLRMKQGDVPAALAAIEVYVAAKPADVGVLDTYAELLLDVGRLDDHLKVRDRLVRLRPYPAQIDDLLAMYRHHGRTRDELDLLRWLAGARQLTQAQYERLGRLLSARGEWAEAARWLRIVDRLAPPGESGGRLALLHVLIESGEIPEAIRRAEVWLAAWRSPHLSAQVLLRLAQIGSADSVVLARRWVEIMPETTFQIAGVLTQALQAGMSREMLAAWVERAVAPSAGEVRDYIHASLAAGETRKPLQTLLYLVHKRAPVEIQARFAEEIAYAYGAASLGAVLPMVSSALVNARPLLAAELAFASGNPRLASLYLDRVDPTRLADERLQKWLAVMREVEPPRAVVERLVSLWERKELPQPLLGVVAREAAIAGYADLHNAIWASARR